MSLINASVLSGATYAAPTGGTAMPFVGRGIQGNSHTLYESGATDARVQKTLVCTFKDAKISPSAPNGYTQKRAVLLQKEPLALDNGNRTINTFSSTLSVDIETTVAEIDEMKLRHCQYIMDSDFTEFWKNGSLA